MALVAIDPSTIYTGNQYSLSIAVAPNSTPLTDPSATVRAAIVSPRLDANLSGTIDLTFNATTQEWQGTFTGAQTQQLLTNPDDLTSGLLYSKPKIEVEVVGAGYTRHYQVTASASLIHDGPIEPPPPGQSYITSDEFEQHTQLVGVEGHIPSDGLLQSEVIGLAEDLQEIRESIDSLEPGATYYNRLAFTPVLSQDSFLATKTIDRPELSQLFLNTTKQVFGQDYLINGSQVLWQGVFLDSDDFIEFFYY